MPASACARSLRAAAAAADSPTGSAAERPIASPAVRRRAWDLGIDLEHVHGSGPAGRIMQDDLDAYARAHPGWRTAPGSRRPGGRGSAGARNA